MGQYPEHLLELIAIDHNVDLYENPNIKERSNMKSIQDHIRNELDALIRMVRDIKDNKDKLDALDRIRNTKGRLIAIAETMEAINNNKE